MAFQDGRYKQEVNDVGKYFDFDKSVVDEPITIYGLT